MVIALPKQAIGHQSERYTDEGDSTSYVTDDR